MEPTDDRLELFFSQSLDGFFFMMLDAPIRWDAGADKEALLDYVFDHQRVTKVNDAMLKQYGASREQFLGITPRRLYAHDLEYGRRVWRDFFDQGRLHVETEERRLDGLPIFIEGDYICLYDDQRRITGHFGIQRDVTERRRLIEQRERELEMLVAARTAELAISEHRVRAILSALPDLVFLIDEHGRYVEILSAESPLLARAADELKGRRFHELFPDAAGQRTSARPVSRRVQRPRYELGVRRAGPPRALHALFRCAAGAGRHRPHHRAQPEGRGDRSRDGHPRDWSAGIPGRAFIRRSLQPRGDGHRSRAHQKAGAVRTGAAGRHYAGRVRTYGAGGCGWRMGSLRADVLRRHVARAGRRSRDAACATALWPPIVADAEASLQDLRALERFDFRPERYSRLDIPVLLQVGTESPRDLFLTDTLAGVLPRVQIHALKGQAHEGMTTAPELYVDSILAFLGQETEEARQASAA